MCAPMTPEKNFLDGYVRSLERAIGQSFPQIHAGMVQEFVSRMISCMHYSPADREIQTFVTTNDAQEMSAILRKLEPYVRYRLQILLGRLIPFDYYLPRLLQEANFPPEMPPMRDIMGSDTDIGYRRAAVVIQRSLQQPEGKNLHFGAKELLDYCKNFAPTNANGTMVSLQELHSLCRTDEDALRFMEGFTERMEEQAARADAFCRKVLFVPRSADATDGGASDLTPGDKEDIRVFALYLCELISVLAKDFLVLDPALDLQSIGNHAEGRVMYETGERVVFSFLQQRFPAMFRSILDLPDEQRAEATANRMQTWSSIERVIGTLQEHMQAGLQHRKTLRPKTVERLMTTSAFLGYFGKELHDIILLTQEADNFDFDFDFDAFDEPLESRPARTGPNANVINLTTYPHVSECIGIQAVPGATRGIAMHKETSWKDASGKPLIVRSGIHLHRDGGKACAAASSTLPLEKIFHPEHPICVRAASFREFTLRVLHDFEDMTTDLGLGGLSAMGAEVPVTALVSMCDHVTDENSWFYALPRAAAETLGAASRIRELTPEELDLVTKRASGPIADPVAIDIEEGGGDEAEAEPSETPDLALA